MFRVMAKFGAAYGVRNGIHVGVGRSGQYPAAARPQQLIMFAVFRRAVHRGDRHFGVALWSGSSRHEQTSPDMEVPIWMSIWRFLRLY